MWKSIQPIEGLPVVYLGVYVTRWRPDMGEPTIGFIQDEGPSTISEGLERLELLTTQLCSLAKSSDTITREERMKIIEMVPKLHSIWLELMVRHELEVTGEIT